MEKHRVPPFEVKICGVKSPADVDAVRRSGGDAVGLNFVAGSVRQLDLQTARSLSAAAAAAGLIRVGVFTTPDLEAIARTAEEVTLDVLQLHGDHHPDCVAQLRERAQRPILLAIRLPTGPLSLESVQRRLTPLLESEIDFLIDAHHERAFGGTGHALDWLTLGTWAEQARPPFWVLAGGLSPENVSDAIRSTHAPAVDVASGVEDAKGVKSTAKIQQFIRAAKRG